MNIVMIMSGGVGNRFGSAIPKQYNLLSGLPVIDYVVDAVLNSEKTEKVVVVMDPQWINYSEKLKLSDFDFALNGNTRLESMYNGLKLIKEKYPCDKLVIVDAVRPFLYSELIDDYFDRLDAFDAVITSEKITGGFTDIYSNCLNRDDYIVTQSPEAFRFDLLWENFDINFPYQETACMLPQSCKRDYYYGFKNNLKLTYDYELGYAEFILKNYGKANNKDNLAFFDKEILLTEGIKSCLLLNYHEETLAWIDKIYEAIPKLVSKWKLTFFMPNQVSRFGLVLQAKSLIYGEVIVKFIPDFIERYQRELEAFRFLPDSYMCRLIDWDDSCNSMLMTKITPAHYASFEDNIKLTEFFRRVVNDATPYAEDLGLKYIPDYLFELREKIANMSIVKFFPEQIEKELKEAEKLYLNNFSDEKKYVIHGDLHELNILNDGQNFWGIDPIGFVGPIELECVRFIRNDVRNHKSFGLYERFDVLMRNFSRLVDAKKLALLFQIDMAFCTYNSTYENDTPEETQLDLQLITIVKEWMKNNF